MTATEQGAWSYTTGPLSDGPHALQVTAVDLAGNEEVSSVVTVTVDTVAPAKVAFAMSDDSGLATDGVTNDATPTFSGSAEEGSLVTVATSDDTVLGTASADGTGAFSIALDLADGTYALKIFATDAAANTGEAASFTLVVDTVAPSQPIVSGFSDDSAAAGDFLTNDRTLTLTGSAEAGTKVAIYDGLTRLDAVVADAAGAWSFTTEELVESSHSFTVTATDLAENAGIASAALTVSVDATAPGKPVVTAFTDDEGTGVGGQLTDDSTLHLAGTGEAGATIVLSIDGIASGLATIDGSGSWTIDTPALSDGQRTLRVAASDAAGNLSAASDDLTVTVDTGAPAAPVFTSFADDTGEDAADAITKDGVLVLSGAAEADATVRVYLGDLLVGQAAAAGGDWSVTTGALTDGTYAFTATATDASGNVSVLSSGFTVTVDLVAPTQPSVATFSANSGDTTDALTNDDDLELSGIAEAGAMVALFDDTALLGTVRATAAGWSLQTGHLSDGEHHFTVVATDVAGNESLASDEFIVRVDTAAPQAPVIASFTDDSGAADDGLTNDVTPTITGTAEAGALVELFEGSSSHGTATADVDGKWSLTATALEDGPHVFTATATDASANTSASSEAFTVRVDTAAPAAPAITAFSEDSGVANDARTNDATPTLSGTAEAGAVIELFEGTTSLGQSEADGQGVWSVTTTALDDGKHVFTAKATDAASNASVVSESFEVTFDTTAPGKPSIDAFAGNSGSTTDNVTNDATPTLTGQAEAGTTVTVFDGSAKLGDTLVDASGTWSYTADVLGDGAHALHAVSTDAAGNDSVASDDFGVAIDTQAPGSPVVVSFDTNSGSSNDRLTNDATPTLHGTAEANSTVTVFEGVTSLGTTSADETGAWAFDVASLGDGEHAFTAQANDAADNTGSASDTFTVTVDTQAPAAPVVQTFADNSGSMADRLTNDTTPNFSGTAEAGALVALFEGARKVGDAVADADGQWSVAVTEPLVDGPHGFHAAATDVAGNGGADSELFEVVVDTVAPNAPSIESFVDNTGSENDNITNDDILTLSGMAAADSTVTVFDGTSELGTAVADGDGNWSFVTPTLGDGEALFKATATDAAGNTSVDSETLTVVIDTQAPGAAYVTAYSVDSGSLGDGLTNDATP
ncbi:MAG: Leukotoxin, partial [Pseudomonadota bacterium]